MAPTVAVVVVVVGECFATYGDGREHEESSARTHDPLPHHTYTCMRARACVRVAAATRASKQ